ncbi:nicotinate phosphoribosyltransferase [Kribbella orskensis]|uniref:Nicotinate phosphoribosyltransferase n=2 Tax=Kribbellaceae TaxID=2726069 RepID=A0ABY2B8U8_9ACTN|nr:nicotinate phosphoribosyltransferase [Kribbella sp. VKM Ac-2500]TCO11692.1 nicotinate phosphoribosyltransferase [Kribbella orskensis]
MSDVLITDLYEANMALAYLGEHMTDPATFSLFVRNLPAERGYLVAAGLEQALSYLERFRVNDSDLLQLGYAFSRPDGLLGRLRDLSFTGDVLAVPEGRIVFAGEPLLEVTAPLPQAQLVESYLLNQVSFATALASKAARSIVAAGQIPVVDFSLRRAQGVEAGMQAVRSGAIVGFSGTSNVAAAAAYGMPAVGTMAHSFVEAFADESAAFRAFARNASGPVILLVDTYDTEQGVRLAAEVLRQLPGGRDIGIRLDSGDLAELSDTARRILDDAGLERARIVVSGGLDEYAVERLVVAHAPIDVFAVGTSADTPYLDTAYKLVEYAGRPVMKLSAGKVTLPGRKQVFREPEWRDVIACRDEPRPAEAEPLLEPQMLNGVRVVPALAPDAAVAAARRRFRHDLDQLPAPVRRIQRPSTVVPVVSAELGRLTNQVRNRLTTR